MTTMSDLLFPFVESLYSFAQFHIRKNIWWIEPDVLGQGTRDLIQTRNRGEQLIFFHIRQLLVISLLEISPGDGLERHENLVLV